MSSLIELEEPFRSMWRKGYLQMHGNGRRYVCLFNSNSDRTIISYARYLLCVKEGRIVDSDIHADHADDDRSNDHSDNIQPLTALENIRKGHLSSRGFIQSDVQQICVVCRDAFLHVKERATCGSYECRRKHIGNSSPKLSDELVSKIKQLRLEGGTSYSISDSLGISRNTVMKYW